MCSINKGCTNWRQTKTTQHKDKVVCTWLYDDGQGGSVNLCDVELMDYEIEMNSCWNNDCAYCSDHCCWIYSNTVSMVNQEYIHSRHMWNKFFLEFLFSFGLLFEKNSRLSSECVWFSSVWNAWFASNIIVIYYLRNSRAVNLQQILQHYYYVEWTVHTRLWQCN